VSEEIPHESAPEDAAAAPRSEAPGAEAAAGTGRSEKRWYIVHTYSGHEQKARQALLERAKLLGKEECFDEILIPEEQVVEMVKGEKRTSKRKFFPGYILVRMHLDDETWHIVRGTARITGFVGGAGNKPTPISDEEVARMTQQIKEGAAKPKLRIKFEEGENVRVVSGPFANFQGFIDQVRPDKEKVRVMVQVFGRATPVEVDYTHLEKA
jgi:transcriptional antiterminator NusG